MGVKIEDTATYKRKASIPGPGNYNPLISVSSSKYGFGSSTRKSVDLRFPAPGAYTEKSKDKFMK
jgi:hypothetical protein